MLGSKILETEVSRYVTLGQNVLDDFANIVEHLRLGKQGIMIRDEKNPFFNINETAGQIESGLEKSGRKIKNILLDIIPHSPKDFISQIVKLKPNFIIVFGNSSTIEFVKYVIQQTKNPHLDWISIPTTPDHDGLASPFIFLNLDGTGEKYYGLTHPPIAIIADITIIEQSPKRMVRSGVGDLLSRFTGVWDWKLASRLRGETISDFTVLVAEETTSILTSQIEIIKPNSPEFIRVILKGLIIAGFLGGFSANIRSIYGSEHRFSQALDHIEPGKTLHGERVALGTIMMSSLQGQDWRGIRKAHQQADVPVTANELGIKQSSVIKALVKAVEYPINQGNDKAFYTILGEQGLTEDAAVRLAYRTGVIGNRPGLE
ncbi:MAG: iron-containing alcohol dehydrogenase [Candidatus Hodarchaeales archaeon]|jgi:glycerol-1-phosphate dehydrogenase [NAD(P)+]